MTTALSITKNIHDWLFSVMPEGVANIVEMILIALVYLGIFAIAGLFLVLLERRVAAWFQLRIGPNRVGFQGLLQTMADALKLLSKELTGTVKADKFLIQFGTLLCHCFFINGIGGYSIYQGFSCF